MCRAIATTSGSSPGEVLEVLVKDERAKARVAMLLQNLPARFHILPFGDIWMRDIAPVFLTRDDDTLASVRFKFNGWGNKYSYSGDTETAERVQELTQCERFASPLILEGGGVESDGNGLCLTTRDVALNDNRNPSWSEADVESALADALGARRVVFLERGLKNDHTDGHIDNVARFIGENTVLCMRPKDRDDPNAEVLGEIEDALRAANLVVETMQSPGLVAGRKAVELPASYLNFYIANHSVVAPVFGSANDELALRRLGELFPGRRIHAVNAKVFLEEGGTVHCITQQEPRVG